MASAWGTADQAFKTEKAGLIILAGCFLAVGSIGNILLTALELGKKD
jgi:hypothetical protein